MPQIQSRENWCHLITDPHSSQAKLSLNASNLDRRDHQEGETFLPSCPFSSWPCFWAFQQAYQLVAPIVRVFFFFCNSNTCPLETGRRPLNSQMVTVMFIDPIHRSASMLHKVPKRYIARHLATGRVSISLALRLALKVLFVLARLILGKQELFLTCYLPHFCPQSCSSNFWWLTLCQNYSQTKIEKELPDLGLPISVSAKLSLLLNLAKYNQTASSSSSP